MDSQLCAGSDGEYVHFYIFYPIDLHATALNAASQSFAMH